MKKDYRVGYGKPPKDTQFKKGQRSANPHGRPKGKKSKRLTDYLEKKLVVGTRNGRQVKKTISEVLDQNLVKDAVEGSTQARALIYRIREAEAKEEALRERIAARKAIQPIPNVPVEQARRELGEFFQKMLDEMQPHVAEAMRLGIFEENATDWILAPWAREAAEARRTTSAERVLLISAGPIEASDGED